MKENDVIVITNPMVAENKSAKVTLSKFLRVISSVENNVMVIGGNISIEEDITDVYVHSFSMSRVNSKIMRILNVLRIQILMALKLFKCCEKQDKVYFWIADKMLLPYLVAKMKGLDINYFIYGNVIKESESSALKKIAAFLIKYMASNADYICMESLSVINEWPELRLKKYKIIHLYTDKIEMLDNSQRKNKIGMLCRLSSGKHVVDAIKAMHLLHSDYPDWKLEIIGSGKQEALCKSIINDIGAKEYIKLYGWVASDNIYSITKEWKYFLFPSDTEGLPNGLIEMMGQGIPAIASDVGGIHDVIVDGDNGIILEDTTPITIKNGVVKMLESCKDYEVMSRNAYLTILEEFTLSKASQVYKKACVSEGENT